MVLNKYNIINTAEKPWYSYMESFREKKEVAVRTEVETVAVF